MICGRGPADASKSIAGFARNDCEPLNGDHMALPVKWKGGTKAPAGARKARFYLKRAFLYGFNFGSP